VNSSTVTPEKRTVDILKKYNGQPPFPYKKWTKALLIKELLELDNMTNGRDKSFISRNQFMQNIVTAGKTDYKHYTGIMRI